MEAREVSGEEIAKMRLKRQLSQGKLGELVGCSATSISFIERGVRPDSPYVPKVIEALSRIPVPDEDDGTLSDIHGTMSQGALSRLKNRLRDENAGEYGWCQLCPEETPATRLHRVGGDLYALCDEHKIEDVNVWRRRIS